MLDIKIPDPPTSLSPICLNGVCGRKASCFQISARLSSIHGRKPRQLTPRQCDALPYLAVFLCWVPQIRLSVLQVHKSDHFPPKREKKHSCRHDISLSYFFPVPQERSEVSTSQTKDKRLVRQKVSRTRRIVPRVCRAKRFGPQIQLHRSSSGCQNPVRE